MADVCSKKLRPEGFDVRICTSDVTCYDGPVLQCIPIANGDGLNEILAQIDILICGLSNTIGTPTAADIVYNGQLDFGCIIVPGSSSVEDIIELFGTQICTNTIDIENLTGDEIGIGSVSTFCYTPPGSVDTVSELFSFVFENMCNLQTQIDNIMLGITAPLVGTTDGLMQGSDVVIDGGEFTDAGLSVTIDDGSGGDSEYIVDGRWVVVPQDTVPLTATADNYLDYDTGTDAYVVTAVTIGFPAPPIVGIRLWKFETNALNVVTDTDMRNYSWLGTIQLEDLAVTTAKIANLAVTGAKMETLGLAVTVGDPDFFEISYDTKGRVTASSFNIDLTGVASGDVLSWDGVQWIPITLAFITGSGTAGNVARFTGASSIGNSSMFDDGTTTAIGIAPASNVQFRVRTTIADFGIYTTNVNAGTLATAVGIFGQATGATAQNIGLFGSGPNGVGLTHSGNAHFGVYGTSVTTDAFDSLACKLAASSAIASTGNVFALWIDATTLGSGTAIGIVVENGGMVMGGSVLDTSALLEMISTTQGFLPPRMTTVQRDAIATPAPGLVIYNTTTNKLNVYTGAWEAVTSA